MSIYDSTKYSTNPYTKKRVPTYSPLNSRDIGMPDTLGTAQMIRLSRFVTMIKIVVEGDHPNFFIVDERGEYLPVNYGLVHPEILSDIDLAFAFAETTDGSFDHDSKAGYFMSHYSSFIVQSINFWKEFQTVNRKLFINQLDKLTRTKDYMDYYPTFNP